MTSGLSYFPTSSNYPNPILLYDALIYDTIIIILYKYTNKLIKAELILRNKSSAFSLFNV